MMEQPNGYTLKETIEAAAFPLSTFVDFVEQALDGLICAHEAGFLHQDIRPENLQLSWGQINRFQVKWLNFSFTSETPAEQTSSDIQTDLFALGCVFYFALTQRQAFDEVSSDPMPISLVRPDLPAELSAWVMDFISLDPDSRPTSARSALRNFRKAIEADCSPPSEATGSLTIQRPVAPSRPRRHEPSPAPIAARSFAPTRWLSLSRILGNMVGAASF